jgi:hypothetical protein
VDPLLEAWSATSTMLTTATGAFAGHPLNVYFASIQPGRPASVKSIVQLRRTEHGVRE